MTREARKVNTAMTLDKELVQVIDDQRKLTPRSTFVNDRLRRQFLPEKETPVDA